MSLVQRRSFFAYVVCASVSLAASGVFAEEGKVAVQVEVVLASNKGSGVEPPELKAMKETFEKQNIRFSSFKRLSQQRLELGGAQKATTLKLPNGGSASLTLLKLKESTATVRVDVAQLSATDVELGRVGSIYQLAGDHVGGKLILVLSQPPR